MKIFLIKLILYLDVWFNFCKKYFSLNKDCKYNFNHLIKKQKLINIVIINNHFMLIIECFAFVLIIIFYFPSKIN